MLILKDAVLIHLVKQFSLPKQAAQACAVILVPSFLLDFVVDHLYINLRIDTAPLTKKQPSP